MPAFGFRGHFTAAVSRGPAPGQSRGWCGPAFHRSFSCTRVLQSYPDDFFSAFFGPTIGRRLAFACFPFFFDHFDWQICSQTKKKAMQALFPPQWRAPRIWVLPKWKQRSLDDQRRRLDGLRWAYWKSIVTQSLNWKRGPFSLSRSSWHRTLTDVQTPIAHSITHMQTWLNMNSDVDCMRNSSHQV